MNFHDWDELRSVARECGADTRMDGGTEKVCFTYATLRHFALHIKGLAREAIAAQTDIEAKWLTRKCCARVPSCWGVRTCNLPAVVEQDGKYFCARHDVSPINYPIRGPADHST